MAVPAGYVFMKTQNTHWYRRGWSYTSCPWDCDGRREVERVGLHCCTTLRCPERHAYSADEYHRILILREQLGDAREANGKPRRSRYSS